MVSEIYFKISGNKKHIRCWAIILTANLKIHEKIYISFSGIPYWLRSMKKRLFFRHLWSLERRVDEIKNSTNKIISQLPHPTFARYNRIFSFFGPPWIAQSHDSSSCIQSIISLTLFTPREPPFGLFSLALKLFELLTYKFVTFPIYKFYTFSQIFRTTNYC